VTDWPQHAEATLDQVACGPTVRALHFPDNSFVDELLEEGDRFCIRESPFLQRNNAVRVHKRWWKEIEKLRQFGGVHSDAEGPWPACRQAARNVASCPPWPESAKILAMSRRARSRFASGTRPAGISLSDDEHAAALQRVRDIVACLTAAGWPGFIVADSGNGAHALGRIDLPADDGGLVQRCLQAQAGPFDDAVVKVDTSVYNPARIWKLYGSLACKGDDIDGRP